MIKNRLLFAGSQTLLASENEFNSTGKLQLYGNSRGYMQAKVSSITKALPTAVQNRAFNPILRIEEQR